MRCLVGVLLLALAVAACEREGPTVPMQDPNFAAGGNPGKPDRPGPPELDETFEWQYAATYPNNLDSDCWGPFEQDTNGDGVNDESWFDCLGGERLRFVVRVVDSSGVTVESGTVRFTYCETDDGEPAALWTCCCIYPGAGKLKGYQRAEARVPCGGDGKFEFVLPGIGVGMKWAYEADAQGQPELFEGWYDFLRSE